MVKIREGLTPQIDRLPDEWLADLSVRLDLTTEESTQLLAASKMVVAAEEVTPATDRLNVWLYAQHMCDALADFKADSATLIAAVLYRGVREEKISLDIVREHFGAEVALLINGVLRMAVIGTLRNDASSAFGRPKDEQIEAVRKMLVAMIDDVRVGLIKIAERTIAIRTAKYFGIERQQRVAREVRDVYAPLAHRLGIGQLKWELEDLAFRYLEADTYKEIAKLLDEKRLARQTYVENVVDRVDSILEDNHISAEVAGRAKHIFSIWKKMQRKDIGFSQIYDVRAIRILVETTRDCYAVLGLVHSLWRHVPNEFDDYIAAPKENGYRSLHTAVIGPEGKVVEVQIRTHKMHFEAEFGVCAHWLYKATDDKTENVSIDADAYEQKVEWLRTVLSWHEDTGASSSFATQLKGEIVQDRAYVFTPDGHIVDLPLGATVLDFAYQVHTEIGHRCRGAKVNGRVVPLNHNLKNGDQVEIIKGKREMPNRAWLSPSLGYIHTSKARSNISYWFKQQAREQNIADGRILLDNEFKLLGLMDLSFERLVAYFSLDSLDDLYESVGASDISVYEVLEVAQGLDESSNSTQSYDPNTSKNKHDIAGVGNLNTILSTCCSPNTRSQIVGFVNEERLVEIHKADCSKYLQAKQDQPERTVIVSWGRGPEQVIAVELFLEAWDRTGLLGDVAVVLDAEHVNITGIHSHSLKESNTAEMHINCEVDSLKSLSLLIARLGELPNVINVRRF